MSDEFLYLTLYKKTCASHVIKCMIVFSDVLYIFVLPATETADFPSLIICHNVSYRRKSFSSPQEGKCCLLLHRTQEKFPIEPETNLSARGSRASFSEAKCVIVYTYTSDWFRGKNSQRSMVIMTVYNLRSGPILAVLIHSL